MYHLIKRQRINQQKTPVPCKQASKHAWEIEMRAKFISLYGYMFFYRVLPKTSELFVSKLAYLKVRSLLQMNGPLKPSKMH